MARLACVDLPAFPLQLFFKKHPEWKSGPAVVVDQDKAQGRIAWANEAARRFGILPGMSYAQGLSLNAHLAAGTISDTEIEAGISAVIRILVNHSPRIEASREEPGIFFLDPSGLERIESSASRWARGIRDQLSADGYESSVVVGFSRFGVYAAAKTFGHGTVFQSPAVEQDALARIPLNRLHFPTEDRDHLARLGVLTVADFLALPESGLTRRFAPSTLRLHREGSLKDQTAFRPEIPPEPMIVHRHIDPPETLVDRLLFSAKQGVSILTTLLAGQYLALAKLEIELRLEDHTFVRHDIAPAEATLDSKMILNLIHLKWSAQHWLFPVTEMTLTAQAAAANKEQLTLFHEPKRDLKSADRALARIRTEMGDDAVVKATPHDGHLPEAQWEWAPMAKTQPPKTWKTKSFRRVRRIFSKPFILDSVMKNQDDGWLVNGPASGPALHSAGPYPVSGGWWNREIRRRYFYVETESAQNLWIYFDEIRKRWFCQGLVE